ncbi:MAG: DUF4372 domain-containing protein [Thermodesulfovibrionales bacterium]
MPHFNTIYNQLPHLILRHQFESLVGRYNGEYYVKYFTCWQQLIVLAAVNSPSLCTD